MMIINSKIMVYFCSYIYIYMYKLLHKFIVTFCFNVNSGMAYCGVIGHIARKYYAIIGPSVDRAIRIMDISFDKVISRLSVAGVLNFLNLILL